MDSPVHIDRIEIRAIKPDPTMARMLGRVTLYLRSGPDHSGNPKNAARPRDFHCSCAIPCGSSSTNRIRQIKSALIADATSQLGRLFTRTAA